MTSLKTQLHSMIRTLSLDERHILTLHYAEQLSPREISLILNMTEEKVLYILTCLKLLAQRKLNLQRNLHVA